MEVFEFYSQFSDFIEGYQDCFEELINSKAKCDLMQQSVNEKLQQIKEQQEREEKLWKQQEEQAGNYEQLTIELQRMKLEAEMQRLKIQRMEEHHKKEIDLIKETYERQLQQYHQQSQHQILYQSSQILALKKRIREQN